MGLRVNTNTAALNAKFQLHGNNKSVGRAMERLSSGSRINRASDDAAGLAVAESMRANMRGLKQADRNAQDGISLTQIAEGSLAQIANILVRLREISIQSASDTISDKERVLIQQEYGQMISELDRIASSTEYNGVQLLAGVGKTLDFQINTKNSNVVDRISFDPVEADMSARALGIESMNVVTKQDAQASLEQIDHAIAHVSDVRAAFGSVQSRLITTTENILSSLENISSAHSRIKDTDIAEESSEMSKKNLMLQAGTSILAQANQQPGQALALLNKG
jgi:flagellin